MTLFGLYLILKYFGTEWINLLLGWYFALSGVGSVWKSLVSMMRFSMGNAHWKKFDRIKFLVLKGPKGTLYVCSSCYPLTDALEVTALSLRTPSLLVFPLGAFPSVLYTFLTASRKSALLTDILSLSFSHNALSLLKIDSFQTGCILLSGLFFYDIWWVFGTEVVSCSFLRWFVLMPCQMVKVATSLDIPIKLLWPKSMMFSSARGFTMLGLGDVVIPGTFVALALRFDYYHFIHASPKRPFVKPYFSAALTAYVAGLATTMAVMHIFGAAQPALLYLRWVASISSPTFVLNYLCGKCVALPAFCPFS